MLRPDTRILWEQLHADSTLRGFVLIGDSALALHFRHRISKDLNFAFVGLGSERPEKLPHHRLNAVLERLHRVGISVEANDAPADWQEYGIAGMDLLDCPAETCCW